MSVFDFNFNRHGIVDEYEKLEIERNYCKLSELNLFIAGSKENIDLLQPGRILTTADNPEIGYIIKHFEYVDEKGSLIEVIAPSLNSLIGTRTIEGQQRFYGNIEDVVKGFVNANAINPRNPKRVIPNLRLASNNGITGTTDEVKVGGQLDEYLYELCNKFELTFDVVMNHEDKTFDFTTWKGVDRSTLQSTNSHVIFSKEFDNVISQNYVKSDLDTRTTAVVAGEGEGNNRTYVTVNDELSGFARVELFVDARDLQSEYIDDNGDSHTMTPAEYQESLKNRGLNKLTEHEPIETFESEVDMFSQFVYGRDFGLGDKVSVRNDDINKVLHTRVSSAKLLCDKKGIDFKVDFGSNIPTFLDKIKRMVK